jgi:Tetratricopeptide repeat
MLGNINGHGVNLVIQRQDRVGGACAALIRRVRLHGGEQAVSQERLMADDTIIDGKIVTFYSFKGGSVHEALAVVDQTLIAMEATLDDDHPFTLSCQINKANCLHDLRRLSEVESLQRDVLERLKRSLGANHPDTQVCEANRAIVLRAQERAEEAEALQLRVIMGLGEALGNDHPSVTALREWRLQNRDLEAQPT